MTDVTGANCELRPQRLTSGEPWTTREELQRPSVPRATAASFPSVQERKRGKQSNQNRTATYETFGSMELNRSERTVAEGRRLVGREG